MRRLEDLPARLSDSISDCPGADATRGKEQLEERRRAHLRRRPG